jgi:hypothetical protein
MFRPFFAISAGLLTAVLALPVHADTIITTGTLTGTVTNDFTTITPPIFSGTQSITGSGHGVLGAFTFVETDDIVLNTLSGKFTVTDGEFTNTYSGGNTLFGTYYGGGISGGPFCSGRSCGIFPTLVTGGTGAYLGYTGSITVGSTVVNTTGALTGVFAGKLSVPSPAIGAGLPGLIVASGGLLVWWRSKRRAQAVA